MCLQATTTEMARGEDSRSDHGLTARTGTSVGYSDVANARWTTLGGHVAAGYRLGSLALEGEYERSKLLFYTGLQNRRIGEHKRFGASLRWYFARIGRPNGNTLLLLFGEADAGWQRGQLEGVDFSRRDYGGGFGWLLDHKVRRADHGLDSIGWHFGWRITNSSRPSDAMARVVCGKHCMDLPVPDSIDLGMTLSSSLSLNWN
jgi:hypothetical protein